MSNNCDCEGYLNGAPQVEAAQMLAWNHGGNYTGAKWGFCPWCGKPFDPAQRAELAQLRQDRQDLLEALKDAASDALQGAVSIPSVLRKWQDLIARLDAE